MKDTVNIDRETFMQQALELADDPAAGQPNLPSTELLAGTGKTTHTLDSFIKQGLMPNAQPKCWTKRQAHLFSGLCVADQWDDEHIMSSQRHLLVWIWLMAGKQYGITLAQVKKVMSDWAAIEAKLPKKNIPLHARSITCWGKRHWGMRNMSGENEAISKIQTALQWLSEFRIICRSTRKRTPAFEEYQCYENQLRSGLEDAIEFIRLSEMAWEAKENSDQVEQLVKISTWYEYALDCLQSERNNFDDGTWYWARALLSDQFGAD